ncbi:hypothetical protein HZB78_06380 [Candidatus Collierbacteria bacterium]|nr:hypothetical protein [Candidatus Collierbacteria bacterium]
MERKSKIPFFNSSIEEDVKLPVPKEEKLVVFPDRKETKVDYEAHLKSVIEQQRLRKEADASQEVAHVEIKTNLDYALVVGSGDWHIGSENTDYKLFDSHMKAIKDTEGVYAVMVGDEKDNFVLPKFRSGLFEGVLNPQQQADMVKGILGGLEEKDKILARVSGNHDEWTWTESGVELSNFWHNEMKSPLLRNGGFVHLKLNEVDYTLYLHHGKSLFNSNFNPNHASKRAFEFQGPYDAMFSGHTHVAEAAHSWRWADEFKKDYVQVRTGTYKTKDPYARAKQLGEGQPPGACILMSTEDKRMMPFLKLEDGIEALKAINTVNSLIAQGLLGEPEIEGKK